jgi:hypothetical protein
MKRYSKNKKIISIAAPILFLVGLVIIFLFPAKHWFNQIYYRKKAEHTVTTQIKPLKEVLTSLGFTDLSKLDTKCGYVTYRPVEGADQAHNGGTYFDCSSGIDRYIKVPTDPAGKASFNQIAAKLSQVLQANGWQSRQDYPTIPWFQKISQGVDYQPDQLNQKKVNDFDCVVDFFTAYSKLYSEKPAISVRVFCNKTPDPEPTISL